MGKWVRIQDMRQAPSYASRNARLVYLHIAMSVDIDTYTCAKSYRQLARELDMTLGEVRHAVRQLEADGLIATHLATHLATHPATHLTTQLTTHLTILINNENGAPNGAPNNTPNNTPHNTPSDTPSDTLNNNNNNNNKYSPLTNEGARACEKLLQEELGLTEAEAGEAVAGFSRRMKLKRKTWADEADMLSHCLSWAEKHTERRRPARRDDTQTRADERARTEAEAAGKSDEEKRKEEAARWWRFYNEAAGKEDERSRKWRETCRKHLLELGYKINAT